MFAAQELFQLFFVLFQLALRLAASFATSFGDKTRLAEGFGMRKQLGKVFLQRFM
jgi:hypothetical protein